MIPNRRQWNQWSLPSKYTTVGLVLGVMSLLIGVTPWFSGSNKEKNKLAVEEEIKNAFSEMQKTNEKKDQYVKRYLKERIAEIEKVDISIKQRTLIVRIYYYSFWCKYTSHFGASVEIRNIGDLNKEYKENEGWKKAALKNHVSNYDHAIYFEEDSFIEINNLSRGKIYEARMVDFNYDSDEPPTLPFRFRTM
jgi:hypothetical protein